MNSITQNSQLPNLAEFKVQEVKPAIDTLLENADHNLQQALKEQNPTWQTLLKLEEDDEITQAFSSISHMNSVYNTKELRESYEYAIAKLTEFYTKSWTK